MGYAYIVDAVRTPRGKGKRGSLHEVKAVTLVSQVLDALVERNQLDQGSVDDVVMGCVTPLLDQGGNIAKAAANVSRVGNHACGMQINRFCASGLDEASRENLGIRCAINQLAQRYNQWNEITRDVFPAWS